MEEIAFIGPQRKLIKFQIEGKKVIYFDEMWKEGIQLYPYPKKLIRELLKSKKGHLQAMGLLIHEANKGKNNKEYLNCRTEEDLKEVIRKDCKSKGLLEVG